MSLNTAVSGINAAQAALDVTSNDLANVNTTGFKSGAQRFSDIYPPGTNAAGIGVSTAGIERSFQQGNTVTTNNPLDLAIQGQGFFITSNNGVQQYTRDGQFHLDANTNQIVNAAGSPVLGYPGTSQAGGQIAPLAINKSGQPAQATSQVGLSLNLNQGDSALGSSTPFSTSNPNSYNESTSVSAYDSLGNANQIELYFRKQAGTASSSAPDTWQVYAQPVNASGSTVGSASSLTTLSFNASGQLTGGSSGSLTVNWGNGTGSSSPVSFSFAGTTLAAQSFGVNNLTNDGYPPGNFQSVQIAQGGAVQAQYSNGQKATVGHIALASFINQQGLTPVSGNQFLATTTSGSPTVNTPGQGQTGQLMSGTLEQSNVNLSNQLVNLITEQQAYQANTKTVGTERQNVQSLLQI
ncbi:MAG TPA: flagellar hook protein FlgE [Gammaproteobacteria bacterium]|nr:flagellar hook protein FlgE [Gammaproteobacteria bacterium]